MESELQKYEQLANPDGSTELKSKAPSISSTLAELKQQLEQSRQQFLLQPDAPVSQQTFQKITGKIEAAKAKIDERLKETHASGTKIAKLVDKKNPTALPDYPPMFYSPEPATALRRTVAQHFVRTGALKAARVFAKESGEEISPSETAKFEELQTVIEALRNQNIDPALAWVDANRSFLDGRQSSLEYLLHRSKYLRLLANSLGPTDHRVIAYAHKHLLPLQSRHPREIPRLLTAILYGEALTSSSSTSGSGSDEHASPYPDYTSPLVHTCLENAFAREYCARRQMSKDAPLKVVGNIGGGVALPRIEKGRKIMKDRKGDWSNTEEIPVEIPLPPENYYHSIFTCPVSKEQATESNPPMMLQCGHVVARESLQKLTKAHTRVKCPYCPKESNPREAIQLHL